MKTIRLSHKDNQTDELLKAGSFMSQACPHPSSLAHSIGQETRSGAEQDKCPGQGNSCEG
jgi:hypothetical protein